jgi:hypothetical protein
MLGTGLEENPANVISLEEYRRRGHSPPDDPPGPPPMAARKSPEDVLLTRLISADAEGRRRMREAAYA